jgi:hypothetical protein
MFLDGFADKKHIDKFCDLKFVSISAEKGLFREEFFDSVRRSSGFLLRASDYQSLLSELHILFLYNAILQFS